VMVACRSEGDGVAMCLLSRDAFRCAWCVHGVVAGV
jgi:hypothetical protein